MKQVTASKIAFGNVKWSDMYDSELELLGDMLKCKVEGLRKVRGYEFVKSFQKQYLQKGVLSPKQMTQLKRLAKSIYMHLYYKEGV